jgi:hypothetical protein
MRNLYRSKEMGYGRRSFWQFGEQWPPNALYTRIVTPMRTKSVFAGKSADTCLQTDLSSAKNRKKQRFIRMVPEAGIEPATKGL